jgi:hypothetical protein
MTHYEKFNEYYDLWSCRFGQILFVGLKIFKCKFLQSQVLQE